MTLHPDWVLNRGNISNTNSSGGELALMLTKNNGGTRISSTHYVHYGKITAISTQEFIFVPDARSTNSFYLVKTGRWNGVVTAFIAMSNIMDEIDWEFPGVNTTTGQTNFYWQGNIRRRPVSVLARLGLTVSALSREDARRN